MTPRKPTRAKQLGVTDEEYARLLEAQGGHCALCPNTPKRLKKDGTPYRLHVDHDHGSEKVRGLLCWKCNDALRTWVTSDWLRRAADYLDDEPPGMSAEEAIAVLRRVTENGRFVIATSGSGVGAWRAAVEKAKPGYPSCPEDQRDALILRARRHGWTYARIAAHYGVSRQRAWQIVTKAGKA